MDHGKYRVLKLLTIAGFFFALHVASTTYLNSSFLSERVSESLVGLVYVVSSCVALLGMTQIPRLLKFLGSRGSALFLLAVSSGALVTMTLEIPIWGRALAFILYFSSNTILFLLIDVLIEHWGQSEFMGRIRGLYLTATNVGYVLAPFAAGYLVDRLGYIPFYRIALFLMIPVLILLVRFIPHVYPTTSIHIHIVKKYRAFLRSKNLRSIYVANFILQFFYAWMVIYAPIFLHEHVGLPWDTIGILFTFALSAFVLFQGFLGFLADKRIGEKELLILGFAILGSATIVFGLYVKLGITLVALAAILFATRVGASTIEVMSETYFFKKIKSDDSASIGFFRNTYPIAYIIGPLIATGLLQFISIQTLFVILGSISFLGILFALRIRDTL